MDWQSNRGLAAGPRRERMSIGTIILIILVIALLGGFSGIGGGPFYGTGYYGGGGLGLVLVIFLVLLLLWGVLRHPRWRKVGKGALAPCPPYFIFPASFFIAALIDDAASSYPSHAFDRASRPGTVRTV